MEAKSPTRLIAIVFAIVVAIIIIAVVKANKGIELNMSNYKDYILVESTIYEDDNNQWKIGLSTTGLSTDYSYDDIQIEAEITSEIHGSEKINVKCETDGSCTGKTNLPFDGVPGTGYRLSVNVLSIKGRLKKVK